MFRLFKVDQNNNEFEIFPENGIFIVYELFEYKFYYNNSVIEKLVYIEDEVLDYEKKYLFYTSNSISTVSKKRIFENYFGYLKLVFGENEYNFEVRIQKLKVPELEEILIYLWNQDPILFDNFFSRSTLKAKLDKKQQNFNYSSKFVNIFDDFYNFFKTHYLIFKTLPHNVLRTKNRIIEYDLADISNTSIDWLINNLDELNIELSLKNVNNSFQICNNYAVVDKILTEQKVNDFNVYENQIILGSFEYVVFEIAKIKKKISTYHSTKLYYEKEYYSINEFRIAPFMKLNDELDKIENKLKILYRKYQNIFNNTISKNSSPKLTPVFSNKRHYTDAYKKIKLIRDVKINIDGELNLLNIKKLSTLYERFNLFTIVNSILSMNPITFKKENPKPEDNTFQEFYFQFKNFDISVYYDNYIGNVKNKIGLQRISKGYYKPDYVIKFDDKKNIYYYILDSKYSYEKTVKNEHLNKCIKDYILDIGISNYSNTKVEELLIIYPGENEQIIYGNDLFKPIISIIPSKVQKTNIEKFILRTFFN